VILSVFGACQPQRGEGLRISELARATGVPVATIKYYLREGLLPPGTPTAPNQADYDDGHVHRLRLVRVLLEVGGLGIARARTVLTALDDRTRSMHEVLGVAHYALGPDGDDDSPTASGERAEIDRFLDGLGWRVSAAAPGRNELAGALAALRRLGWDVTPDVFDPYAAAAEAIAAREVAAVSGESSRAATVERVVVGTVVFEKALTALRRMAQEHHSAARWESPATTPTT
jgi:DNA-binding transcriptional MerR regulator